MESRVPQPDARELLEVLDAEGRATGQRKARAEVHRDGDWHRSVHLWIVKDGRYALLQRRSRFKDLEPGRVDVSVGGHLRSGDPVAEVLRETEEELGLELSPGALHPLGTRRAERVYPGMTDRELQAVFVARCDRPLEHYYPDCREVSVLYEAPLEPLIALYRAGGHLAVAGWDCQGRSSSALLIPDDLIAQARQDTAQTLTDILAWLG